LLTMARDAADDETYMAALSEIQQIVTWDDPAAIYFAQPETLTVLLRDIQGFEPDLVNAGIFDYYRMYRGDSQPSA
jgi:peptide/nickel transport system substrate-binding protein